MTNIVVPSGQFLGIPGLGFGGDWKAIIANYAIETAATLITNYVTDYVNAQKRKIQKITQQSGRKALGNTYRQRRKQFRSNTFYYPKNKRRSAKYGRGSYDYSKSRGYR